MTLFNKIKMNSNLGSFISDSIIYSFFNVINKLIPFFLLPLLVRVLSSIQYGQYAIFLNIESLLIPVVSFNIYSAITVHFFNESFNIKEYISTLLFGLFLLLILFLTISIFINPSFILLSGLSKIQFQIALITASLSSFFTGVLSVYRLMRKPIYFGVLNFLQSIGLFICIILISRVNPKFESIVLVRLLYFFLFSVLVIVFLFYKAMLAVDISKEWLIKMFKFSAPTVVYSLSAFVFLSSDRLLIKYFLGFKEVGHYSAIYQIASIVSLIGVSINAAWMPWLFENLNKKSLKINRFIVKLTYLIVLFLFLFGLVCCFIYSYMANKLLPLEYYSFLNIGYPIIIGFVFEGIYLLVSPYILYVEKTKYNALIGVFIAIINVCCNVFLIPRFGIIGASYSFLLSWIFLTIAFFIFSIKVYPMPWLSFFKSKIDD